MEITFEQLPKAVSQLYNKLEDIERLLRNNNPENTKDKDELLTVQDTAKFLSLSVPTVYGLISKGQIPVMKRSKRCYFSKAELITYLRQGRIKTVAETEKEAEAFINRKTK